MTRRRSAAARGLGYRHRVVREQVLARDGRVCHWCGGPADQADHLVARVHGGRSTLDNMVAACSSCNAARGGVLGAQRRRRGAAGHPFFVSGGVETPRPCRLPPRPSD